MKNLYLFLLILLIFFFPAGGLLRLQILPNVHVLPQDIIIGLLSILVFVEFLRQRIFPVQREFFLFSLLFIFTGILSLIINSVFNPSYNFFVSILYPLRYVAYLSIFFYPVFIKDYSFVNRLLFYSGSAIVLVGYLQFFFYNNLGNLTYLGWDDHLYRLFSTFLDPNFAGIFYVIFLGFLIGRIMNVGEIANSKLEVIIALLTVVSIYLTYSRSAFLALLILLITVMLLLKKKFKHVFFFVGIAIAAMLVFADFKVEGLNPLRTFSSFERLKSADNAVSIIQDNAVLGVGFNAYRYAQIKYNFRIEEGALLSNADAGTDNSFLFVLATTGIFGFTSFMLAYYYLLRNLFYNNKIYFSTIVAVFTGSLFINVLFYMPILTFLFLMLAFDKKIKGNK